MFITPEMEYPLLCVAVYRGKDSNTFGFELINLNLSTNWPDEIGADSSDAIDCLQVIQLDKNSILICFENELKILTLSGKVKQRGRQSVSHIQFDFVIKSLVCLPDSVLAFHDHGMQGRSLRTNEVMQEITSSDISTTFRVLGHDNVIVLESRQESKSTTSLYVLMGHEDRL